MNHEIAKNQQMAATHRELFKYPRIKNALLQKRNKPGNLSAIAYALIPCFRMRGGERYPM